MSSSSFDATIDLAPRPSLRALKLLFWLHVVPLALMLAALEPGPAMAALATALGVSWLWLRRHPAFGFGRKALARLTWHQDGKWTLHQASGENFEAELLGNSLVHQRLIVLNFAVQKELRRPRLFESGPWHSRQAHRARVLLGDELEPELLRRLRARLRIESF